MIETHIVVGDTKEGLKNLLPDCRIIVITDATVSELYSELIGGYQQVIIPFGESNKTLQTVEYIYRSLLDLGADRQTFIVGVGGGIVTDITGFVAATFMRGVRFGFVATTLLAQVDASVGGKNGVNLDGYKNIIGTFRQPEFTICDSAMLKTLLDREFRAGVAEIIKSAIIGDVELFEILNNSTFDCLRRDDKLLNEVITRSLRVKTEIVNRDEFDRGERNKLNLGHTFAHAIEKVSDQYNHGEAVAIGVCIAVQIAENKGIISQEDAVQIVCVFKKYGFETTNPIDFSVLVGAIGRDKKRNAQKINLILPTSIGNCIIYPTELSLLI